MKLITFQSDRGVRVGCLQNDSVIDASHIAADMQALLALITARGVNAVQAELTDAPRVPLASVRLLAPVPRPAKNIMCVGKNYHEHAKEFSSSGFDSSGKESSPSLPIIFSKPATTVIGPDDVIPGHLDPTESVDYENELAVIIGKPGRGIQAQDAYDHVLGYTIINDVTSRALQRDHKQWFLGKGIDGFCPMGPMIVTTDEIADVDAMRLRTFVNGELRQDAVVKDLIFDIPTLIATLSRTMTLETGDIIATGTPAGVGLGFTPPRFLKKDDRLELHIDGIGVLRNTVG
jgi:2-keto-4-pentenoate hydratase/2-oxohepta-3-ene-1,7-dioic acid hydratase in catechol pathway